MQVGPSSGQDKPASGGWDGPASGHERSASGKHGPASEQLFGRDRGWREAEMEVAPREFFALYPGPCARDICTDRGSPEPETRNLKPETRSPRPEIFNTQTRSTKRETRNTEPETETRNPEPKPETRNPKPETEGGMETSKPKPETRNTEADSTGVRKIATEKYFAVILRGKLRNELKDFFELYGNISDGRSSEIPPCHPL